MLGTDFAPWPDYSKEEIEAVAAVLRSNRVNYWTGDVARDFERQFAAWADAKHAVALANGTVALEEALRACGVGPGTSVITSPRTFVASAFSIASLGAVPIFADVELDTQNISAATIERVLRNDTKAILCVHLAGMPCDMYPIIELARANDILVIEDCAQAHGARYDGTSVGAIGDVGAWSFCQDKIMTTGGEGGMLTTNNDEIWATVWSHKDHGKSWEGVYERRHPPGPRLVHDQFGTNGRLTEMQAAIGLLQLAKMPEWTKCRTKIGTRISQACLSSGLFRAPVQPDGSVQAWYRCYAFVKPERLKPGWTRDRIIEAITAHGVPCLHGSAPEIYMEKAFDETGWRPEKRLKNARELGETSICFLTHPTLTESDIAKTIEAIEQVASEATS